MRSLLWMSLSVTVIASASASPAYAQFAAEDAAAVDDTTVVADDGDDTAADPADPYAADPAYAAPPAPAIVDRTVGDLAASLLGAKGAQHAQDAEAVVREVIDQGQNPDGTPSTPASSDAISLVRDVLGAVRKRKDPK